MMQKKLYLLFSFFLLVVTPAMANQGLEYLPVQDQGRIKPFDTFARESLQLVYGKKQYKKKTADGAEKLSAVDIVMTWMLLPEHWDEQKFVEVKHLGLKNKLNLTTEQKYFSPKELILNEKLGLLITELEGLQKDKQKLNSFFQAVARMQNQLSLYKSVANGLLPGFLPQKDSTDWRNLNQLNDEEKKLFSDLTMGFLAYVKAKNNHRLNSAVQSINEYRQKNFSSKVNADKIKWEVFYNEKHPFQWTWILYLFCFLALSTYFVSKKEVFYKASWLFILLGFAVHTFGFAIRIYLTGRPPVSNMYETVVWVPWASVLFAMIFDRVLKNKFFLFAASIIGTVCLILADLAPVILDPSLNPLEPVLRSTLWLTVHVLTITISYSAFFLAFVLGDVALVFYLLGEEKRKKEIKALADAAYRSIQVGVVLLAAGTILGGVWADYSWGRFWGWDPKETWALIALLGYLAILHGRLAGWVKPFGFMIWSVLSFDLVIMAWYGVNFVLGAGLHSYGFGGGGLPVVASFVFFHLLFVILVWQVRKNRLAHKNG